MSSQTEIASLPSSLLPSSTTTIASDIYMFDSLTTNHMPVGSDDYGSGGERGEASPPRIAIGQERVRKEGREGEGGEEGEDEGGGS